MNSISTFNYTIAGVTFSMSIDPALEHPHMKDFRSDSSQSVEFFVTVTDKPSDISTEPGKCLYDSDVISISQTDFGYNLSCKDSSHRVTCDYNIITNRATILIPSDYSTNPCSGPYSYTDYIFFILKEIFFYHCLDKEMIPVHSSSIIYDGRAYLFSAPSKTGKSTHTSFWCDLFSTEILDGDVTMLSINNGVVFAHGMPWCGTSGQYCNKSVPLGNVIFIKRSDANTITRADFFNSVLNMCARSFAPNWTQELAAKNLKVSQKIVKLSPCLSMNCLPIPEAATLVKEYIDSKKQA